MKASSSNIQELKPNEYIVFGSNRGGYHGAGAAKLAYNKFGAVYGVGEGITGQCYALPTMDKSINPLTIDEIKKHVDKFLLVASENPDKVFLLTEIACGLGGKSPEQIAPLFLNSPDNVHLPQRFINQLIKL